MNPSLHLACARLARDQFGRVTDVGLASVSHGLIDSQPLYQLSYRGIKELN